MHSTFKTPIVLAALGAAACGNPRAGAGGGKRHPVAIYEIDTTTINATDPPQAVIMQAHMGSLMDPIPHPDEINKEQKKLTTDRLPQPNVRS